MLVRELDLAELVADHQLFDGRERRSLDDRLDVVAVAVIGRNATGRGVRVGQQAFVLELGQHMSHRGAADAKAVPRDQCLRTDGHRARDVFLDDGPEDRLGSEVQRARGSCTTRQVGPASW